MRGYLLLLFSICCDVCGHAPWLSDRNANARQIVMLGSWKTPPEQIGVNITASEWGEIKREISKSQRWCRFLTPLSRPNDLSIQNIKIGNDSELKHAYNSFLYCGCFSSECVYNHHISQAHGWLQTRWFVPVSHASLILLIPLASMKTGTVKKQ